MPITTLDPKTALIVVDLQCGIVALPLAHPVTDIVERSTSLLEAFRSRGLPVVLVNVAGAPTGRTDAGTGGHTTDSVLARHEHSVTEIFPRIAEKGTTQDALDVLTSRS
jgi:nicotinamidase-related amidase